ncbi:hypothetical protein ACWERY_08350 [Streptomyces sp. NPDC004082]|jgi:hypothetical protein|uniref:hypothetical protein n=1 Tax=unclassified Streptomyces TaxID=2593676 RepID=UPI0033B97944
MPEHVSNLQLAGASVLALATAVWVVGLVRLLRRSRSTAARRPVGTLRAVPGQRRTGPGAECVELTPQERAAFAGLVRQFSDNRS